jgi:hypothetical protein
VVTLVTSTTWEVGVEDFKILSKNKLKPKRAGGVAPAIQHLRSKEEALN